MITKLKFFRLYCLLSQTQTPFPALSEALLLCAVFPALHTCCDSLLWPSAAGRSAPEETALTPESRSLPLLSTQDTTDLNTQQTLRTNLEPNALVLKYCWGLLVDTFMASVQLWVQKPVTTDIRRNSFRLKALYLPCGEF